MTLRGKLSKLMIKTTPEVYRKYVVIEKGKMEIYVQLLKAIYGCICSALLLYRKLIADLEPRGFKLNRYNLCVVKKIIDKKQFTITWHVENLKLLHVDKKVVEDIIEQTKGLYVQDMRIIRGKKHNYIGMMIDFSLRGQVVVTMVDQGGNILF